MAITYGWHIQAHLARVSSVDIWNNKCSALVPPSELVVSEPWCTNTYLHPIRPLKDAYTEESDHELDPLFVIADEFVAIIATIRTAFLGCPRGMCWVHIARNVDKKLLGVRNEEKRKRFRRELHLL